MREEFVLAEGTPTVAGSRCLATVRRSMLWDIVQGPPRGASKFEVFFFLKKKYSLCVVQRFGLSGFLAHSFVVSNSQDEEHLLRHLCSE